MISQKDQTEISKIIDVAEERTRAELIPMVVTKSDAYPAAHFRCAILMSFIFTVALYLSPLNILNPIYFIWIQIPGFVIGYFLANIDMVARFFVTNKEMEEEVYQRALEAFFEHNLHSTDAHLGVLLFISRFEKKVKIISDRGIKEKIADEKWQTIIEVFKKEARSSNYIEPLKASIPRIADVLALHFPHTGNNKNEIRNHIIIE